MASERPHLGIDFGTTFSSMSWFNFQTGKAEIIVNSEGETKTPSSVYYGPDGTSVGQGAVNEYLDAIASTADAKSDASARFITSIKRNLLGPAVISLPGGRFVKPADIVAMIIGKLKRDAQETHFHEAVLHATITVPATFSAEQRAVIEAGARIAGFQEVKLLEEPIAAAMAFAHEGQKIGQNILVYDLGGGTLDLAVLSKNAAVCYNVALPPTGDPVCGGDDFDKALYDYCLGQSSSQGALNSRSGGIDLGLLSECRQAKERLTTSKQTSIRHIDRGRVRTWPVERINFERLINDAVQRTVRKTRSLIEQAKTADCPVDTLVLIGGSTRVPLVAEKVKELMSSHSAEMLRYANQDVTVALGASYTESGKPKRRPTTKTRSGSGGNTAKKAAAKKEVTKIKPESSSEKRIRIVAAQRKLWAGQKAAVKNVVAKEKQNLTPEGRLRIAIAVQKRWEAQRSLGSGPTSKPFAIPEGVLVREQCRENARAF